MAILLHPDTDKELSLDSWYKWAVPYASAAGLQPPPSSFRIDVKKKALWLEDDILWEDESAESLLAVAEWYTFFHWAQELAPRYLICHAAILEYRGRAVLLVGKSGSGKSRLALALVRRGLGYVGDEFAVVCPETLKLLPFPKALCIKGPGTGSFSRPDPHFEVFPYPSNFARRHRELACCIPHKEIVPLPGARLPVASVVLLQGAKESGPPVAVPRWRGTAALYEATWWRMRETSFRPAAALAREVEFWALGRSGLDEMAAWVESIVERPLEAARSFA